MSEFFVTILRSHFNGKMGQKLDLIHYAVQIDGIGIVEFGRYDGTNGKLRIRPQRDADEEVVTAFKVKGASKSDITNYMTSLTAGQDWSYSSPNCVTVAMAVVRKYGPQVSVDLAANGENNFNRVIKAGFNAAISWF